MNNEITIPDGTSGNWKIETFAVSEQESMFTRLRAIQHPEAYVPAGTYQRLMRGGTVVMSDTPMEIRTHSPIIHSASGCVLLNGLGLGVCLRRILKRESVTQVTVIEHSEDVIKLVAPSFQRERVTIIQSDALTVKPSEVGKFDSVWHDIWDFICADNLEQMKQLHRKWGRNCAWQGSWARHLCERYA